MPVIDIQHTAIKTQDLEATNRFYTELLGMKLAPRPNFPIPGSWIAMGATMIHIMAGPQCLGKDGKPLVGGGAVDHIALAAQGFDEMKARFIAAAADWRQFRVDEFGLWQLFVRDPNGVMIELNFMVSGEPPGSIGPDDSRSYRLNEF